MTRAHIVRVVKAIRAAATLDDALDLALARLVTPVAEEIRLQVERPCVIERGVEVVCVHRTTGCRQHPPLHG